MGFRSTRELVDDLRKGGKLIDIHDPFSPHLEIPEIQRRVYARGGPALLFHSPVGSRFPMASNLFGSIEQARYLFRDTMEDVKRAIELKVDESNFFKRPLRYRKAPLVAWRMLPKRVHKGPVLAHETDLQNLPSLQSWPNDGGPFITLPQVLSQSVMAQGLKGTNLGMYRIQLSGNHYVPNREVGLHYQIHRGIGVHHEESLREGKRLRVNIFVGGSPAMTLAAVMPLPEGMSELSFAGALAGHRIPMIVGEDHAPIYADADFCIVGEVDPTSLKPEGPFGDHLGYYSLVHDFPFLHVKKVYHRQGAIWPFTVVGRPPQEDTSFGELIHELTGPILPTVLPGVKAVHAVDAAGVHPLLLAIGSERYTPYRKPERPQELLTQANAILGQGQLSLAKYLFILDEAAAPQLKIDNIAGFFYLLLERVDFEKGLHFQTRTTIDTLDYSGDGLNYGSKLVIAATGGARRELATSIPELPPLPEAFGKITMPLPGVLAIQCHRSANEPGCMHAPRKEIESLQRCWAHLGSDSSIAILTLVDDATFTAQSLENWLWVAFTRSNPANDIFGIGEFIENKHWGCRGPMILDARRKPNHAPPLIEDPDVTAKIDAYASRGGSLARYL